MQLAYLKPPASLSFQPKEFDEHLFDGSDLSPEVEFDLQNRRRLKRKIFDMVRWRKGADGKVSLLMNFFFANSVEGEQCTLRDILGR